MYDLILLLMETSSASQQNIQMYTIMITVIMDFLLTSRMIAFHIFSILSLSTFTCQGRKTKHILLNHLLAYL